VLDQHGIVYNQPVVLNERQAGVEICSDLVYGGVEAGD
jgi:hypothetical protein